MEEGARGDPHSNGLVENAAESIKGHVLTMKLGLERRLGILIPDDHPVLTWLAPHAAETLTKYEVGKDGKTSFGRLRGKRLRQHVAEFGEKIWYKLTEGERTAQKERIGSLGPK